VNQSRIGSDFDDFLREEKLLEAAQAAAVKRVLAFQVEQEMKRRQLSKTEMATRMKTSRAAVERLLDPANTSITLATLGRAAAALGKNLSVEFTQSHRRVRQPEPSLATQRQQQQRAHAASGTAGPAHPAGRQTSARPKSSHSQP
jgi:predicted XRE-type DNA-binding protein